MSEIRLTGFGAQCGEFRTIESHYILIFGVLVFESFKQRRIIIIRINRPLVPQQGQFLQFLLLSHIFRDYLLYR